MSFPATQVVNDDFKRPDGGLGGSWTNALGTGGTAIAGGRAGGTVGASAYTIVRPNIGYAVYARMPVGPGAAAQVRLYMSIDLTGTRFIRAQINNALTMTIGDSFGSVTTGGAVIAAGDYFALTTLGNDYSYAGWTWSAATNGPWTQQITNGISVLSRRFSLADIYPMIEFTDTTGRMDNFGCETFSGGNEVTPFPLRGHGAC